MSESNAHVHCRFCDERHRARFLCGPAKRVLDALLERGMRFDMPTIEFPAETPAFPTMGSVDGDQYLEQLVVQAAVIDVADTPRPALVFTGRSLDGPLPRWIYPADEQGIHQARQLVNDVGLMAINGARRRRSA